MDAAAVASPALPDDACAEGSTASANDAAPRSVDVFQDRLSISARQLQMPSPRERDYMPFTVSDNDVVEFVKLANTAEFSFDLTTLYPLVMLRIALSHEYAWLAFRRAWPELWRASLSGIVMRFIANRFTGLKTAFVFQRHDPSVTFGVLHGICTERTQVPSVGYMASRWTVFLMEFGDLAPTRSFGIPAAVQVEEYSDGYKVRLVWNRTEHANTEIVQFLIPTNGDPTGSTHDADLKPVSVIFRCRKCGLALPDTIMFFDTVSSRFDARPLALQGCVKCHTAMATSNPLLVAHFMDVKNLSASALVKMYTSLIRPQSGDDNDDAACYPLPIAAKAYADLGNASFPTPWYNALQKRARERKRQDREHGPPNRQDPRDFLDFIMCKKPEWKSPLNVARPTKRARLDFGGL